MKQIQFDQMQVGKHYRIEYPWIEGYANEGTLTSIRNLTHAKDEIHYEGQPYRQFVLLTDAEAKKRSRKGYKSPFASDAVAQFGDSFFYDNPMQHTTGEKFVRIFEI